MNAILASIRHNFANLLAFSGRDSRAIFWPWAIILFLLSQAITQLLVTNVMVRAMTALVAKAIEAEQSGRKPDPALVEAQLTSLIADIVDLWPLLLAGNFVMTALLAASIVRRLHDVDRSGWWALPPALMMGLGAVITPAWMDYGLGGFLTGEAMPISLMLALTLSMANLVLIIWLIVWMAQPGEAGPNRFGLAPPA
ncbi:MAG: DUF805 domain-containing protein [Sphingosinicella sp.]